MTKVFISYARDGSYGENLAAIVQMQLQHAGFEVFRDVSGLKAGDIWYHKLEAELETSNIMVLVVSEKVRTSKWVANEVSMAEEIGIPVIPVLAENIRKPLWLRHLQVLDFCDAEDWERLFDSLGEYASAELKARLTVGKTADHGTSVHEWLPAFASDYASLAALKQKTVATGAMPSIVVETCQASAPVVPWASHSGNDQYGQYADLTLQNVTQRFRWIMPGTFMMGSLESEEGRVAGWETQREVTLSKGFWLADTACTQEFWQAVTGNNPAHFKGDLACPVECVSWDDVQQFIKALNQRQPALNARLPSEAEWEYACRAGTETAFCFGGKIDLSV
ncbi:MAG: TIR domain-containing protein, partial [Thiolinea sp.]